MKQLLSGNEGVARGVFEAGISFASAYPGTPSTEILETIGTKYKDNIVCEWAPNEKVAVEAAVGASIAGARSMAAMKHVGVNVAADPLMTAAYLGVTGGMMIISADDPGLHSSQNEQDNRYYAKFAQIAMLEPSDSQEAKDFVKTAMEISEEFDTPVMLRMTTRVCHSKSLVEPGEPIAQTKKPYARNLAKYDPVPAVSRKLHLKVEERNKKLEAYANTSPLNTIEWNDKKIGIVAAGAAYQYAKEVFGDKASYLKLGFTNPLPMDKIRDFCSKVETTYVIEELEPFMEDQMHAAGISCIGKAKITRQGELNPDIIRKALLGEENTVIDYDKSVISERPPVLCAGCPHRGIFYELGRRKDVVISSDIGCYGLGGTPPLNAKDYSLCMGAGFSMAHGMQKMFQKFGDNKRTVGVMGDSTFFHSGMTSMLDAVYNNSNVLLVVLDNRITGMTGHQQNPGSGFKLNGEASNITDIEQVVRALGVQHVRTIDPNDLKAVKEAVDWGFSFDEPAVIITRWPCVLKKLSEADKSEFNPFKTKAVVTDKCIGCKLCLKSGCPALMYKKETKKTVIDRNQCVGCMVCAQVCPKNAIEKEVK